MITYNLGRDFSVPFQIDDKHASVSHNHASIIIDGDQWLLRDNDSTNGTYVEENGKFRRIQNLKINQKTWIRLGEQGHRGYYFKARRVIMPNDYREDFVELNDIYQELENAKEKLESHRRTVKFLTPTLMIVGLVLSALPGIEGNFWGVRLSFMLPGFVSPFIQDILLNKLEKKVKSLHGQLICPKCRRPIDKHDILNREHPFCHAH